MLLALSVVAAGLAGTGDLPASECRATHGVPGPEDLELDLRDARGPRLIVSSQEQRQSPRPMGTIFSVPLAADGTLGTPKAFELVARDARPFHPHGISLVAGAPSLLYVINHVTDAEHAIEVFEIEGDRLLFRPPPLTSDLLTTPNDLVALPDGHVYVTNSGAGRSLGGLLTALLGLRRGNVVHHHGGRWWPPIPAWWPSRATRAVPTTLPPRRSTVWT